MGVMTIHAIHTLGHHLLMHIGRQSFFGVAFATNAILIHHQQGGIFGAMGQMTGRAVSYLHRAMDKSPLNKVGMTHHAEFKFGADQADFCLKIMAVLAFLFFIRFMPGHDSLTSAHCCQFFTGHHGQIFRHLLFMIGGTVLVRRRQTGNAFKNRRQDLMPGNLIASGQEKAEGEKKEKGKKGGRDKG